MFQLSIDLSRWCNTLLKLFRRRIAHLIVGRVLRMWGWRIHGQTRRQREEFQDNLLSLRPSANPKELWDIWVLTKQTNVYMVPKACTDPDTVLTCVVMQGVWLASSVQHKNHKQDLHHAEGDLSLGIPVPATSLCVCFFFLILKWFTIFCDSLMHINTNIHIYWW